MTMIYFVVSFDRIAYFDLFILIILKSRIFLLYCNGS